MYYVGICDDGQNICSSIENMVMKYAKERTIKMEIEIWYTGESLWEYLKSGNSIDILFLDIELLELSGIQVATLIRNCLNNRQMQIIYISGKNSYAQELFKTQPMDFLIKPIDSQSIRKSLDLAIEILDKNSKKFQFQNGKEYYYIPFGEIMYFTSQGRKIVMVCINGEKSFYGKLKKIVQDLPLYFITIHQSYIVNPKFIARYTYEMIELVDGTILTISKINRKKVRKQLLQEG